jgi:hypothetical protein
MPNFDFNSPTPPPRPQPFPLFSFMVGQFVSTLLALLVANAIMFFAFRAAAYQAVRDAAAGIGKKAVEESRPTKRP